MRDSGPDEDQGREIGKGFKRLLCSQFPGGCRVCSTEPLRAGLWSVTEQREWDCGHASFFWFPQEGRVRQGKGV